MITSTFNCNTVHCPSPTTGYHPQLMSTLPFTGKETTACTYSPALSTTDSTRTPWESINRTQEPSQSGGRDYPLGSQLLWRHSSHAENLDQLISFQTTNTTNSMMSKLYIHLFFTSLFSIPYVPQRNNTSSPIVYFDFRCNPWPNILTWAGMHKSGHTF